MCKVQVFVEKKDAKEIIMYQKGKFFTVHTVSKKTGSPVVINGRTGVTKYLRGGVNTVEKRKDLMTAFSVKKMDYCNINMKGIRKICANGVEFIFNRG